MVTKHGCPISSAKCIFMFLEHKIIYFFNTSSKIPGRLRCISVQFSRWVMPDSLQPHGLKHTRLPCPSTTPRACSNSCPWSRWCHPTISSSVVPFSSCLQSSPASGSFPMSQFFASGGQSIGTSASALSKNIQDWFPLELTGWISLLSKARSRVFSNTTVQKHQFFTAQLSLQSNSYIHTWPLGKKSLAQWKGFTTLATKTRFLLPSLSWSWYWPEKELSAEVADSAHFSTLFFP